MSFVGQRPLWAGRVHYAWVVVAVTFLTILISSGVRAAPGVLIHPLEVDFGWNRAAISFAVSIGLFLYGFSGPFAGQLVNRFGPRGLMAVGVALAALSTAGGALVSSLLELDVLWGVVSGLGTGLTTSVLGVAVANRWFVARRGFVLGLFGAAASAGQLVLVPLLMWLVVAVGWRSAVLVLGAGMSLVLLPVLLLMRNRPADVGLEPYGGAAPAEAARPAEGLFALTRRAVRVPEFWLLSGTFFVCGATSSGLVGTHLIPHSIDHGIPEVAAAGAVALMGTMNFVGTVASGWLTDRIDPRKLLACYYSFRGLSLLLLPFVVDFPGLAVFAIVFGLDYIATVPPTATLAADIFGRRNAGTIFGWVFLAHQIGAALAAYLGGLGRVLLGSYEVPFLAAGFLAIAGGLLALRIGRAASRQVLEPEVA
jgi:sugar phosphate permease